MTLVARETLAAGGPAQLSAISTSVLRVNHHVPGSRRAALVCDLPLNPGQIAVCEF